MLTSTNSKHILKKNPQNVLGPLGTVLGGGCFFSFPICPKRGLDLQNLRALRGQNPGFWGSKKLRVNVNVVSKFGWVGGWWENFGMVTNGFSATALTGMALSSKNICRRAQ